MFSTPKKVFNVCRHSSAQAYIHSLLTQTSWQRVQNESSLQVKFDCMCLETKVWGPAFTTSCMGATWWKSSPELRVSRAWSVFFSPLNLRQFRGLRISLKFNWATPPRLVIGSTSVYRTRNVRSLFLSGFQAEREKKTSKRTTPSSDQVPCEALMY